MRFFKLYKTLVFCIVFFICADFTQQHKIAFFNSSGDPYNAFYQQIVDEISDYDQDLNYWNRDVTLDSHLEDRKKLRWVYRLFRLKANTFIKYISDSQNYISSQKLNLYLYSLFIGIHLYLIYI